MCNCTYIAHLAPIFFHARFFLLLFNIIVFIGLYYGLAVLLRRVLDIYCQIDSSKCLAQLTPARVGKARSVHVQLGASPHVIRWDIVCLSPQSHTSVWESFHIFIIARQRPFCTLSRFKLLQVDQGSSVPLAKCSRSKTAKWPCEYQPVQYVKLQCTR